MGSGWVRKRQRDGELFGDKTFIKKSNVKIVKGDAKLFDVKKYIEESNVKNVKT